MSNSAGDEQRSEQRKKTIAYGVFGALVLGLAIYEYEANFADNGAKPVVQAPVAVNSPDAVAPVKSVPAAQRKNEAPNAGTGVAPGVAATKMASTSSSLDPTLDETAMLRTESLVYSGNGRNIFSTAAYVAPVVLPKNVPSARPVATVPVAPVDTGPPPPPPINLKYFGTVVQNGQRQAFLLNGEDVYMASQGDIVARRYKIVSISASSVQVEDLPNANKQTLPLQTN